MTRKAPGPKMSEQKRRTIVLAKRRYKVKVIAQPIPTTPMPTTPVNSTPTVPIPTVATTFTQTPIIKSATTSIPATVYSLATRKFAEVPYPSERPQAEENLSIHNSNPPPLEAVPDAPVRQDTPWPSTESVPKNLFETRKDWPIPPTPAPTVKTEVPPQTAAIPHAMVMPKQVVEKCTWGPHSPICIKEEEEGQEDWNSDRQRDQSKSHHPQNTQHPQSLDVPDRYLEQIRLRKRMG